MLKFPSRRIVWLKKGEYRMTVDYSEVQKILPHRYPFLLVDRVEDLVLGKSAVGIKNVSFGEPVFQGHFPQEPIFPGVLILEALAQTAAVLSLKTLEEDANVEEKDCGAGSKTETSSVYFMTIDNAKFRKPVRPGDVLRLCVEQTQARGTVCCFHGEAFVGETLVAEADFMAMLKKA